MVSSRTLAYELVRDFVQDLSSLTGMRSSPWTLTFGSGIPDGPAPGPGFVSWRDGSRPTSRAPHYEVLPPRNDLKGSVDSRAKRAP